MKYNRWFRTSYGLELVIRFMKNCPFNSFKRFQRFYNDQYAVFGDFSADKNIVKHFLYSRCCISDYMNRPFHMATIIYELELP